MIIEILEAAVRALVVALIVWGGLRLTRVRDVLAQKAAWGLVLGAALAMPGLMRLKLQPVSIPVQIPSRYLRASVPLPQPSSGPAVTFTAAPVALPSAAVESPDRSIPATGRYPAPVISQTEFSTAEAEPSAQAISDVSFRDAFFNWIRAWQTASTRVRLESVAFALYLLVAGVLLFRMFAGFVACLRLWKTARPISLSIEEGATPSLRVRESASISSPVTLASGIVLPEEWIEWTRISSASSLLTRVRIFARGTSTCNFSRGSTLRCFGSVLLAGG